MSTYRSRVVVTHLAGNFAYVALAHLFSVFLRKDSRHSGVGTVVATLADVVTRMGKQLSIGTNRICRIYRIVLVQRGNRVGGQLPTILSILSILFRMTVRCRPVAAPGASPGRLSQLLGAAFLLDDVELDTAVVGAPVAAAIGVDRVGLAKSLRQQP